MTNSQLYFAVGVPTIAVLASLTLGIVQVSGLRDDIKEMRQETLQDVRELRADIAGVRQDIGSLRKDLHEEIAETRRHR